MKPLLQVEDDPNDVFFFKHAMKKSGVANAIQVASNGQQAIDYLKGAGKFADRELFPLPCLVLLDLKLPYVMGLDVLKWIRSQPFDSIPVIILSASAEPADIATAYQLGANAFLTKPSEASKLVDIVKAIHDFWLTHNVSTAGPARQEYEASPLATGADSPRPFKMPPDGPRNGSAKTSKQEADNLFLLRGER